MAHITREDGERFVIPSYRDVLSAKKPGLLKREILLLSSNYGEYIALQKKSPTEYEVAFSNEPGALLGETVWNYFKRPRDLIYCEEIPNTNEAILVIVKSGSVYLDGSFPIDTIPDELIVFQTQQNNFEIYLYGNVPISQTEEEGKFTFDASSVKSFSILSNPVFPTLSIAKQFQLQLVDVALKAQGIGVLPVKNIVIILVFIGLIWMGWQYLTTTKEELPQAIVSVVNPYQAYYAELSSPDPMIEIQKLASDIMLFYTIPGWFPITFTYGQGSLRVAVKSQGARTNVLFDWATKNNAKVEILSDGFYIIRSSVFSNRQPTASIYQLNYVTASLIDRLSYVLPGNHLTIGKSISKGKYYDETSFTVDFNEITPTTLNLIGQQFKKLPFVLNKVEINVREDSLSGKIDITALGN